MRAISSTIKRMGLGSYNGVTGEYIKDISRMVCRTGKESTKIRTNNGFRAFGIRASLSDDSLFNRIIFVD